MKKNYFFTLILTLCFSFLSFAQTEIFNLAGGGTLPTDWVGTNNVTSNDIDRGSYYLVDSGAPSDMLTSATYDLSSYTTAEFKLDVASFGSGTHNQAKIEISIDGGTTFTDLGLASTTTGSSYIDGGTFTISNVSNQVKIRISNNGESGRGVRLRNIVLNAFTSDPSIAITAPENNAVFPGSTTEVPVIITVLNFNLSADNGSGMSDSSGDGYIKATLEIVGTATEVSSFFSTTVPAIEVIPGATYNITTELLDNSGASLSPKVESTITFSVELPCVLVLEDITTTCNDLTSGTDTYTGSIAFTGGNSGTMYTITAPTGVTIGGDNPNTSATGTITFAGITEGTDADVTIVADATSSCNFARTLNSPTCVAFPLYESFDYTADTDLIASALWQNNSNSSDEIKVVTGTIVNPFGAGQFPDPVGNMLSFDGSGSDSYIEFNEATSGKIYSSFIFEVTDISSQQANGGYFAMLSEDGGTFKGRIWLRPDATDNTKFNVGMSTSANSSPTYHTTAHAINQEVFVVIAYDFATSDFKTWVNPDPTTFEATEPAANITLGESLSNLGRFGLRQDSTSETPPINFDELRIDTTWAGVTPKSATASIKNNSIEGFATYPNPVTNNRFTITSNSTDTKEVKIFNVLGKQVFATSFSDTKSTLDIPTISAGLYILKVTEGTKTATSKLVIK